MSFVICPLKIKVSKVTTTLPVTRGNAGCEARRRWDARSGSRIPSARLPAGPPASRRVQPEVIYLNASPKQACVFWNQLPRAAALQRVQNRASRRQTWPRGSRAGGFLSLQSRGLPSHLTGCRMRTQMYSHAHTCMRPHVRITILVYTHMHKTQGISKGWRNVTITWPEQ